MLTGVSLPLTRGLNLLQPQKPLGCPKGLTPPQPSLLRAALATRLLPAPLGLPSPRKRVVHTRESPLHMWGVGEGHVVLVQQSPPPPGSTVPTQLGLAGPPAVGSECER